MLVLPVSLAVLDGISSVRIHLPGDLKPADHRATVLKTVGEVQRRFPDGLPLLDPVEDMGIVDPAFRTLVGRIETLETALRSHALHRSTCLAPALEQLRAKLACQERITALRRHIRDANSILQMEELKARKRVLRRLAFASDQDVIEMKGRVACEISTGDELLLTEMIFAGVFNTLTPQQTVALLSCFIFEEKSEEQAKLKEDLAGPLRTLQETAKRIAQVSNECKLEVSEQDYVDRFRPELMDVVYAWCHGAKFAKICKMTDVFEGSIIRCLRRLEELLRQMAQASKSIGNTELEAKFQAGITCMKRDIVFANSLYL
jgi:ATP-dependent RNA helicase DOB1